MNDAAPKLTDSPWFWLMLFSVVATILVMLIAPKYAVRMARKERMTNANAVIAVAREAGVEAKEVEQTSPPVIPYAEEDYQRSPQLNWIFVILATLMIVGAAGMHYSRYRFRNSHVPA